MCPPIPDHSIHQYCFHHGAIALQENSVFIRLRIFVLMRSDCEVRIRGLNYTSMKGLNHAPIIYIAARTNPWSPFRPSVTLHNLEVPYVCTVTEFPWSARPFLRRIFCFNKRPKTPLLSTEMHGHVIGSFLNIDLRPQSFLGS